MDKLEKIQRQNSGITLIALVVTIIVLLILAGISIGSLSGKDGIVQNAKTSRDDSLSNEEEENVNLAVISAMSMITRNAGMKLNFNVINTSLAQYFDGSAKVEEQEDSDIYHYYGQYKLYEINAKTGKVTSQKYTSIAKDNGTTAEGGISTNSSNITNEVTNTTAQNTTSSTNDTAQNVTSNSVSNSQNQISSSTQGTTSTENVTENNNSVALKSKNVNNNTEPTENMNNTANEEKDMTWLKVLTVIIVIVAIILMVLYTKKHSKD